MRVLILFLLALPMVGQTFYRTSVAAVIASQTADSVSSWGAREANPLLGERFGVKALMLKSSIVGSSLLIQHFYLRKHPEKQRVFAYINFATSGVTFGIAIRNFRISR